MVTLNQTVALNQMLRLMPDSWTNHSLMNSTIKRYFLLSQSQFTKKGDALSYYSKLYECSFNILRQTRNRKMQIELVDDMLKHPKSID